MPVASRVAAHGRLHRCLRAAGPARPWCICTIERHCRAPAPMKGQPRRPPRSPCRNPAPHFASRLPNRASKNPVRFVRRHEAAASSGVTCVYSAAARHRCSRSLGIRRSAEYRGASGSLCQPPCAPWLYCGTATSRRLTFGSRLDFLAPSLVSQVTLSRPRGGDVLPYREVAGQAVQDAVDNCAAGPRSSGARAHPRRSARCGVLSFSDALSSPASRTGSPRTPPGSGSHRRRATPPEAGIPAPSMGPAAPPSARACAGRP
jgi:hypothetical protein